MATTFAIFSHNHQGWYNKATEKFESARTEDCEYVEPHVAHSEVQKLLERLGLSTQLSVEMSTTVSAAEVAARVAARFSSKPEPVLHITEDQVYEYKPGQFSADASDLRWPPGFFPLELTTSLGNGLDLICDRRDETGAHYSQVVGSLGLLIYND